MAGIDGNPSGGGLSQTSGDARYTLKTGPVSDATNTRDVGSAVNLWRNLYLALTGLVKFSSNSIGYLTGTGPTFNDASVGDSIQFDFSGLSVGRTITFPDASGTVTLLGNSATGTGSVVRATSPAIVTPTIASFVNATHNHSNAAGGGTLAPAAFGGFRLRVGTQFDKTTTTLGAVTGLTASLAAATSYEFEAVLHVAADAVGGHKYAIDTSDTLTATAIIYQVNSINNGTNAFRINSRQTALGGATGEAVGTAYFTIIKGLITTNAAGTFEVRFAQNSANGTSSVLVGSTLNIWPVA